MLTLASRSPIRKALLMQAGIAVEAIPADVNERSIEAVALADNLGPAEVARRLAEAKALAVAGARPGHAIVGADQILELQGTILHKPATVAEAAQRLAALSGKTHQLHTAVALVVDSVPVWGTVVSARLTMRHLTPVDMQSWLDTEGAAVLSTAGAYRIEGRGIRLFETMEGDYFGILGLPLLPLLGALRRHAPETLTAPATSAEGFT